ncbi:hypothetical protein CRENBAI_005706 [Crenichthys baileyi]|uniref:Uncharacterized protein n=1 Tax=Crenichthys baileyi TaxID=28760 RepID=A0AAV9RGD1_9TELE
MQTSRQHDEQRQKPKYEVQVGDQDVALRRIKGQAGDPDIVPSRHKVQAGGKTCNTLSWAVGSEGVEADRGVETVEAGGSGEGKDKEASRDIETLAAGDEGTDSLGVGRAE